MTAVKWKFDEKKNDIRCGNNRWKLEGNSNNVQIYDLKRSEFENTTYDFITRNDWEIFEEKEWNLVDELKDFFKKTSNDAGTRLRIIDIHKTFIQKVKEDMDKIDYRNSPHNIIIKFREILDKRAGDL